jgi:hypothetical protein
MPTAAPIAARKAKPAPTGPAPASTLPQNAGCTFRFTTPAFLTAAPSAVQLNGNRISSPHDPAELEARATAAKLVGMAEPKALPHASMRMGAGPLRFQPLGTNLYPAGPRSVSIPSCLLSRSGILESRKRRGLRDFQFTRISRNPNSGSAAALLLNRRTEDSTKRASEDNSTPVLNPAGRDLAGAAGGEPLPAGARSFMEPRFRADFSNVRIHTGDQAATLNRQLNAQAFTTGNQIFFGRNKFQPESQAGKELIAHELTHTIQQGAAVQRSEEVTVTHKSPARVQPFLGIDDPLTFVANKANLIPGFRMFTIILGVNPINMSPVDRSAANILRALIEFLPGGGLITQALDNAGVFEKAGALVEKQLATLALTGSAIKEAVTDFIDKLSPGDLLHLGDLWERAKRIFTEPIDRIISLGKALVNGIIDLIKDAILRPIAKLAEGTAGYSLLKAVLGKDPITGDPVPRTAETLIGPFMKLIGEEEIWENMKKANAIARAWAWFQGALNGLMDFVGQIPDLFISAFKALELVDIVLVPRAFAKLASVFGGFLGRFMSWAGGTIWNLLEIIFDVVSPGALGYIKRTGAALKSILKNPLPFARNLVKAGMLGFQNFAANFGAHLKAGLIDWLTGSLPGVYIPKAFSLGEIVKFVFSVLGLTWQNVRQKLVKVVGETAVKAMETGFDIVVTLVTQGPAAAWEKIKEQLANLKDMVIGGITDFVVDMVVKKAVPKIVAMFIPGAGFISAILSIYDTVMVFVNKISKIIQVVTGFFNSIVAIASGAIAAAASRVESTLAGLLSLAINFLAGFAGLGKVADKIMGVINKVRAPIDKALDWLINWIVTMAKKLFAKVFGKKEEKRTEEEKNRDLAIALREADALARSKQPQKKLIASLATIKAKYKMTALEVVLDSHGLKEDVVHIHGEINPAGNTGQISTPAAGWRLAPGGIKAHEGTILVSGKQVHVFARHGEHVAEADMQSELQQRMADFAAGRAALASYYSAQVNSITSAIAEVRKKWPTDPAKITAANEKVARLQQMLADNQAKYTYWQGLNPNDRAAAESASATKEWRGKIAGGPRKIFEASKTRFNDNRELENAVMATVKQNETAIDQALTANPTKEFKITHTFPNNLGVGYELDAKMNVVKMAAPLTKVSAIIRASDEANKLYMVETAWPHA